MNATHKEARKVARKLVRFARANGAALIEVSNGGDRIETDQRENELVDSMVAADDVTLVLRNDDAIQMVSILFVAGNGEDAVTDYSVTPWSEEHMDRFLDSIGV